MVEEEKIPTIDEMKAQALEYAKSIPHLKEKNEYMSRIRGDIIELFIIIEKCFDKIITNTGKNMVLDDKKKGLYLIAGIRNIKDLPRFKAKTKDMIKLLKKSFPRLDEDSISNFLDSLIRLQAIRDIFAHVPLKLESEEFEFDDKHPYSHFFGLNKDWKNLNLALSEFMGIHKWITDIILHYNRQILFEKQLMYKILSPPRVMEKPRCNNCKKLIDLNKEKWVMFNNDYWHTECLKKEKL